MAAEPSRLPTMLAITQQPPPARVRSTCAYGASGSVTGAPSSRKCTSLILPCGRCGPPVAGPRRLPDAVDQNVKTPGQPVAGVDGPVPGALLGGGRGREVQQQVHRPRGPVRGDLRAPEGQQPVDHG